jgi:TolB-like protein/DNA-binding winged helix-turn-helix (wHTH) protein
VLTPARAGYDVGPRPELPVPDSVVRFADFELDGGRYELRRGDRVIKLEKIPFELLFLLVEADGRLVTREQIAERLWGKHVFLDVEHGVNTAIRKIRRALGDDPDQPRFVQTITGRGYRFIAATRDNGRQDGNGRDGGPTVPVTEPAIGPETTVPSTQQPTAIAAEHPSGSRRWLHALAWMGAAVLSLGLLLIGLNVRGSRDRLWPRSATPRIQSLAVLPLENLSGDPAQDYFADGMTDELITMLAKNTGLRIISRTSAMQYKGVHRPLPEIARELGVDGILEGSIARSADKVHMTVQLIHAPSDTHLWAESYDRPAADLGALQDEVSRGVGRRLGARAPTDESPGRPISAAARDAVWKGRYYWFLFDSQNAKTYFQKAIDLEPDYAAAWAGLGDTYTVMAVENEAPPQQVMPQAEAAVRKALQLDNSLADAHNAMAAINLFYRWDWDRADQESLHATQLSPEKAEPHNLRSKVLLVLNRGEDALREQQTATALNPFARPLNLGYTLLALRRYDDALNELRLRSDARSNNAVMHEALATAYFKTGHYDEWAEESARSLTLSGDTASASALQRSFRTGGFRAVIEGQIHQMEIASAKQYVSPIEFALPYGMLQRKEETLRYLERAYQDRSPDLIFLQCSSEFDFLHRDPRYRALVQKMKLPPAY